MSGRRNERLPVEARELAKAVAEWRRTRSRVGRMAGALWEKAVSLGREHGVCRVARWVGVDAKSLRKLMVRAGGSSRGAATPEGFVELPGSRFGAAGPGQLSGAGKESEVTVELSSPDGARLTVRQQGGGVDVLGLFEVFWSRSSCSR